ncbi:MAG: hypothetical protein D6701_01605, partial [Gemmatimonadetes bacterium]
MIGMPFFPRDALVSEGVDTGSRRHGPEGGEREPQGPEAAFASLLAGVEAAPARTPGRTAPGARGLPPADAGVVEGEAGEADAPSGTEDAPVLDDGAAVSADEAPAVLDRHATHEREQVRLLRLTPAVPGAPVPLIPIPPEALVVPGGEQVHGTPGERTIASGEAGTSSGQTTTTSGDAPKGSRADVPAAVDASGGFPPATDPQALAGAVPAPHSSGVLPELERADASGPEPGASVDAPRRGPSTRTDEVGSVRSGADAPAPVDARALGVVPELAARLNRVIERMWREEGHRVEVVEGYRSPERQAALYRQGRETPGPIVTWTTESRHSLGAAADVRIDGGWTDRDAFEAFQRIAREEGLATLGARDPGHVELPEGLARGAGRTPGGFDARLERALLDRAGFAARGDASGRSAGPAAGGPATG